MQRVDSASSVDRFVLRTNCKGSRVEGLDVLHNEQLKVFHGYWSEGYRSEVVHTGRVGHRNDGCTLAAGRHPTLAR